MSARRVASTSLVLAAAAVWFATACGAAYASGGVKTYTLPGIGIEDVAGDVGVTTTSSPPPSRAEWRKTPTSIVLVDLSTGALTTLVTHDSRRLSPRISDRYVVWYDERNGDEGDIYGYDRLTGTEFPIATGPSTQDFPDVDGDYAIWCDSSIEATWYAGHSHIRGMNMRTGEHFDVSTGPGYQNEPRISNGWVVYTDVPTSNLTKCYIRAYQLSTGKTYTLTPKASFVHAPDIGSSGYAVWMRQDAHGDSSQQYGCSVYDRRVGLITAKAGWGGAAVVSGNVVVYPQRVGKYGTRLEGFDILAGTKFTLAPTNGALGLFFPIDGGRIAWQEANTKTWVWHLCIAQPTVIGTYSAPDPYASSVAQSQADFPDGAETAVIANGSIWDDVTVGAGLAGDDSPLLLTGHDALPASVAAALTRLAPKRVQVVGGTASVSDAVLAQIAPAVGTDTVVERTGGSGAADTALAALEAATASGTAEPAALSRSGAGFDGTVVVVSASDKVTSGLVTPVLRARNVPVVFAGRSLTTRELRRLRAAGVKRAVIVGGTKGVSAYSAKQLGWLLGKKNVKRINGKDVYQTSARFNEFAIRYLGMKLDGVGIATNAATTDLLMAGIRNGKAGSLLLLTGTKKLSGYAAGELKARRKSIRRALYVGRGKRLVSKAVRKAVRLIVH